MASVLKAELWGIRHAFKLCLERGWTNVSVETDSYAVYEFMNDDGDVKNHPEKILIQDCRTMLAKSGATLNHTLREGNKCR
ncbi:hypothetical protein LguiA_025701 [Lonicera macranthoides]